MQYISLNPKDVWVYEGDKIEVLAADLSFPTGMGFEDEGTSFLPGAFAVCEQLAVSLGIKEIVGIGFSITHEKTMHQLLL